MKNIWIIALSVVLTGAIIGGGTYYFVNSKAEKDKKELNRQISTLQKQVSDLESQPTTTTTAPTTTSTPPTITPTTDETANWQIYTSKDYGYSIKFPKDLYYKGDKVQQYPGEFGAMDLIISDIENMGIQDVMQNEKIHITVTTSKKSADDTLYEYLTKEGIKASSISEIAINNVKSYKIQPSASQTATSVYTVNNNIVYNLHGINYLKESLDSTNFKLMQQIIDTFKFSQ